MLNAIDRRALGNARLQEGLARKGCRQRNEALTILSRPNRVDLSGLSFRWRRSNDGGEVERANIGKGRHLRWIRGPAREYWAQESEEIREEEGAAGIGSGTPVTASRLLASQSRRPKPGAVSGCSPVCVTMLLPELQSNAIERQVGSPGRGQSRSHRNPGSCPVHNAA